MNNRYPKLRARILRGDCLNICVDGSDPSVTYNLRKKLERKLNCSIFEFAVYKDTKKIAKIDFVIRVFGSSSGRNGKNSNEQTDEKLVEFIEQNNILVLKVYQGDTGLQIMARIIEKLCAKDEIGRIGIDPGHAIGFYCTVGGVELHSLVLYSLRDIVRHVSNLVILFSEKKWHIHIGNSGGFHAKVIYNEIWKRFHNFCDVHLVDEHSTSLLVKKKEGHILAAKKIAQEIDERHLSVNGVQQLSPGHLTEASAFLRKRGAELHKEDLEDIRRNRFNWILYF